MPDVIATVRDQMRARGIDSERAYYRSLAEAPDGGAEWDALVERLTNHETSFFRHPPSFDALRTQLLPALRDRRAAGGAPEHLERRLLDRPGGLFARHARHGR